MQNFAAQTRCIMGDLQKAKTKNLLSEFVARLGSPGAIKFEIS